MKFEEFLPPFDAQRYEKAGVGPLSTGRSAESQSHLIASDTAALPPDIMSTHIMQALMEGKGILSPDQRWVEFPPQSAAIPAELLKYEGYYGTSGGIVKVEFDTETNALKTSACYNGQFVPVTTSGARPKRKGHSRPTSRPAAGCWCSRPQASSLTIA